MIMTSNFSYPQIVAGKTTKPKEPERIGKECLLECQGYERQNFSPSHCHPRMKGRKTNESSTDSYCVLENLWETDREWSAYAVRRLGEDSVVQSSIRQGTHLGRLMIEILEEAQAHIRPLLHHMASSSGFPFFPSFPHRRSIEAVVYHLLVGFLWPGKKQTQLHASSHKKVQVMMMMAMTDCEWQKVDSEWLYSLQVKHRITLVSAFSLSFKPPLSASVLTLSFQPQLSVILAQTIDASILQTITS
ncbi:hypothetical protein VNO78_20708 [Psophocarpus tetragonolobus]|uniref:Uncharacterized protein n=1 Tax=Psophocarpus tetragonolobus TaxID=3891 RepID=A0AAN9XHD8_PSOTE